MTYYRRVGEVPPKRHTQFRAPDGQLYAEELMGTEGFSSSSSLLYHRRPPTALVAAEAVPENDPGLGPNEPLLPRHLRTGTLDAGGDLVADRTLLLANAHVRLLVARPTEQSGLYRNATGDEIVYLRQGSARLDSVFGSLECHAGDYVVVPTSTTHRWVVGGGETVSALLL
jgi:homogentisate 1,2-dioxygenase